MRLPLLGSASLWWTSNQIVVSGLVSVELPLSVKSTWPTSAPSACLTSYAGGGFVPISTYSR